MTWDILICSIVHRADMLDDLLAELGRQLVPGVGVRVFRDNLETVYGEKCQRLLDSSTADYVSFLDDDDWIAEDFIATIMEALDQEPDYVGFKVLYTVDGHPQIPVFHTLRTAAGSTTRKRCTATSSTSTRSAGTSPSRPVGGRRRRRPPLGGPAPRHRLREERGLRRPGAASLPQPDVGHVHGQASSSRSRSIRPSPTTGSCNG
jgi:hypothetical protein